MQCGQRVAANGILLQQYGQTFSDGAGFSSAFSIFARTVLTPFTNKKTAKATIRFFTSVQNKLHYAVSGNTAAEIIYNRADHKKEHMGLTSWEGAPNSKIHKYDVVIAKNYLNEIEIGQLERMVSAYLDLAEMQAMRHIPMTMADWEERLNGFLKLWDHEILKDNGKISAEMAKLHAETEFEKYRIVQDQIYISDFDELLLNAKKLENKGNKK